MGSLMAGWDSPLVDHKSATLKRNRSLTKDEIDAYWRSRKKIEEEHLKAIPNISETVQTSTYKEPEKRFQKSITMPLARGKESLDIVVDPSLEELIKKNGWWTRSNWAFLNEPPVTEAASNKYVPQFHVANMGSSKYHGNGISA